MLREQIEALNIKSDALANDVLVLEEQLKEKKETLKLLNKAKKNLETLEEQLGE